METTDREDATNTREKTRTNADVDKKYKEDVSKGVSGHENDNDGLPTYVQKGSIWGEKWKQEHYGEEWKPMESSTFTTGSTEAHLAAQEGDLETLKEIATYAKHYLTQKDKNGWEPIHEAARNGHVEVIRFLHENGSNINERTHHGAGLTPLALAKEALEAGHPIFDLFSSLGAEL